MTTPFFSTINDHTSKKKKMTTLEAGSYNIMRSTEERKSSGTDSAHSRLFGFII
jgi:hypothetical protein